jgi:hypothetical protein
LCLVEAFIESPESTLNIIVDDASKTRKGKFLWFFTITILILQVIFPSANSHVMTYSYLFYVLTMLCIFWMSGLVPHYPSNLFSKVYYPFGNTSISIVIDPVLAYFYCCWENIVSICVTNNEISSKKGITIYNWSLGCTNNS